MSFQHETRLAGQAAGLGKLSFPGGIDNPGNCLLEPPTQAQFAAIRRQRPVEHLHRLGPASPEGRAIKRPDKAGRLKTFRASLGPTGGGAIKIDPDEAVTQGLCIGEGVETCLAGRQMGLRPIWSVVSTSGVEKFPVLPGVDGLTILRENDANLAGPKASEDCAARWRGAGREVIFADPESGADLNDELRGASA
jgi:Toprim domain